MALTCPNCGAPVPDRIGTVTMLTCGQCHTTLYLDGDRMRDAGSGGDMHDAPMLFGPGDAVRLGGERIALRGHARFSYGRGWWDEFWGTDDLGRGVWVSVDEGDIVLQRPLDGRPPVARGAAPGTGFSWDGEEFRVVERGQGTCVALRGSFGERLSVGEVYRYLNAQGEEGRLISGEFAPDGDGWFVGQWHDPFEVDVEVSR